MKLGQTSIRRGAAAAVAVAAACIGGCIEGPEAGVLTVHLCWQVPDSGQQADGQREGGSSEDQPDAGLDGGTEGLSEDGGPEATDDAGSAEAGSGSGADAGTSAQDGTMDGGASAADDRKSVGAASDSANCGTCEQAGVDSFDYMLEDAYGLFGASEQLRCRSAIELGRVPGGEYRISVWGYDRDGYLEWEVSCRGVWVDGDDTPEYECYIPGIEE